MPAPALLTAPALLASAANAATRRKDDGEGCFNGKMEQPCAWRHL